jgi:hypothetical protein
MMKSGESSTSDMPSAADLNQRNGASTLSTSRSLMASESLNVSQKSSAAMDFADDNNAYPAQGTDIADVPCFDRFYGCVLNSKLVDPKGIWRPGVLDFGNDVVPKPSPSLPSVHGNAPRSFEFEPQEKDDISKEPLTPVGFGGQSNQFADLMNRNEDAAVSKENGVSNLPPSHPANLKVDIESSVSFSSYEADQPFPSC